MVSGATLHVFDLNCDQSNKHARLSDLPDLSEYALPFLGTAFAALVVLYLVLRENDQPIPYIIPSPKTPEDAKILDEPTIKVSVLARLHLMLSTVNG